MSPWPELVSSSPALAAAILAWLNHRRLTTLRERVDGLYEALGSSSREK